MKLDEDGMVDARQSPARSDHSVVAVGVRTLVGRTDADVIPWPHP
jgi:hypothetical protein